MMSTNQRTILAIVSIVAEGIASATPPHYSQWKTYNAVDGLPSDKVLSVFASDKDVWVGTDQGLARLANGQWRTFNRKDGLAHQAVVSIAMDPDSGDVWIGTMGGLSRFSGGRFDSFTQLNSGLANDVVYGVAVRDGEVWAATAAGASRYEIARDRWTLFDDTNTPMHEVWCYSVDAAPDRIYLGVWGGGLLEYHRQRHRWKDYRDPDGEIELDVFRDDGIVHNIVTGVARDESGVVWIGSYFGLSSYDGRRWRNFMDHDSPLLSNFVPMVTTHGGYAWIATDNGVNGTDRENWWTYRRDPETGEGIVLWQPANGSVERMTTTTIFPHNYIVALAFHGDDLWVATEKGVAHGTLGRSTDTEDTRASGNSGSRR